MEQNLQKVIIEDGYIYNETEGEDGEIITEIANYLTIADGKYSSYYESESYTGAFANCPALTEITIPGRAKIVGKYAFANDGLLKKIIVPCRFSPQQIRYNIKVKRAVPQEA